jgi:hypothetical protein
MILILSLATILASCSEYTPAELAKFKADQEKFDAPFPEKDVVCDPNTGRAYIMRRGSHVSEDVVSYDLEEMPAPYPLCRKTM